MCSLGRAGGEGQAPPARFLCLASLLSRSGTSLHFPRFPLAPLRSPRRPPRLSPLPLSKAALKKRNKTQTGPSSPRADQAGDVSWTATIPASRCSSCPGLFTMFIPVGSGRVEPPAWGRGCQWAGAGSCGQGWRLRELWGLWHTGESRSAVPNLLSGVVTASFSP